MDFISYKVSNYLILTGIILGSVISHRQGMPGLMQSLAGLCIPLLSLFVFYRYRFFGAGDLKLFSMIGCFTGPKEIMYIIAAALAIGAVIGVAKILVINEGEEPCRIRFAIPTFLSVVLYCLGII